MYKIKVLTHYEDDDINCDGDDYGKEIILMENVKIAEDEVVATFSDSYHENTNPADAWVEGFKYAMKLEGEKVQVFAESVPDGKWIA